MTGDNGEKKPLPEMTEKGRDAFINILLATLEMMAKKHVVIGLKQLAIDTFPEKETPLYVWDNSKEQWFVSLPKPENKILTPSKHIVYYRIGETVYGKR